MLDFALVSPHRARFERYFARGPGCWEWQSTLNNKGYGMLGIGDRSRKNRSRMLIASRVAYVLYIGSLPDGLCVCHACDNPRCVNPAHLFLGTHADNIADMHRKGRAHKNHRRGGRHPSAKLTAAQVQAIRAMLAAGARQAAVGRLYGVNFRTIHLISHGKIWRAA